MSEILGKAQFHLAATILLLAVFVIYSGTWNSMVSVWTSSSTFVHGFIVLPMSAYLVWRMQGKWTSLPPRPSILGLVFLALSVLAWSIAEAVAVQVVAHFAVVAMLVAVVWTVYGMSVVRVLHFPLLYAFFAVPFGEFLIPPLMEWTASFTVTALEVTGIPVLRDGNFFSLPSGDFQVVEACSGIRYLIVTVVLGLYFAHESFIPQRKRLAFIIFAAVAIVIANGIRAYVVVLIAHYSDMKYATGQDHIFFGWVIFALTIILLFGVGRRYEDVGAANELDTGAATEAIQSGQSSIAPRFAILVVLSAAILLSGQKIPIASDESAGAHSTLMSTLPRASGGWYGPSAPVIPYRPEFAGQSSHLAGRYEYNGQAIEIHVVSYSRQEQGAELISYRNNVVDSDLWRLAQNSEKDRGTTTTVADIPINSATITDGRNMLHILYWFDVGGRIASSPTQAKLFQFWNQLAGNASIDAVIIVVTRSNELIDRPSLLEAFVRDHLEQIRSCIRPTSYQEHACAESVD